VEIVDERIEILSGDNDIGESGGVDGFYSPKCDEFIKNKPKEEEFLLGKDIFRDE
jgi:hypothetical protein